MDAFDLSDDGLRAFYQQPPVNNLFYIGTDSETSDLLNMVLNIWSLSEAGTGTMLGFGTYSITPATVPEPNLLILLVTGVALVVLSLRHWRRHA
jgi:hypothetical protein